MAFRGGGGVVGVFVVMQLKSKETEQLKTCSEKGHKAGERPGTKTL